MSANDAAPTDSFGMTNLSLGYAETSVWNPCAFDIDVARAFKNTPTKFVRTTTNILGTGATLYDVGQFYVFTEGAPASTTIGYLDLEYDVTLIGINRNQPDTQSSSLAGCAMVTFGGASITPGGGYTTSYLSTFTGYSPASVTTWVQAVATNLVAIGSAPSYVSLDGSGHIVLQPGTYRVRMNTLVASDTYAAIGLQLNNPTSGNAVLEHICSEAISTEQTVMVAAMAQSSETLLTLTAALTLQLQFIGQYASTWTQNKTCNLVTSLTNGTCPTSVQIDVFSQT
jgi:hypothetical protein